MRPRKEVSTAPRARRGARRRGPAAIAAAAAVGLALASPAVTASAPAGSAAEPASVGAPGAGNILGVGSDSIPAVGPGSSAHDQGRPLLGSRRKAREPAGPAVAFIYRKGKYRPLDGVPGAPLTAHVGLNNRGQVVGAHPVDESTLSRGFVRNRWGDYEGFDAAPGAPDRVTTPFDISDRGAIAGAYAVGSAAAPESVVFHGFLRKPSGAVITVDVPGASATGAFGINNRGAVVGTYEDSRGKGHGFLLRRGMVTPIDPPDANQDAIFGNIAASDINDQGEIVGFYPDARGTFHGFLYHKGQFTELDPPQAAGNRNGFGASAPFGINNRGQVVGQYVDADGVLHGYLWERKRGFETIDPPGGAASFCAVAPNGQVCGTVAADINDRGQILLPGPGLFTKGDGPAEGPPGRPPIACGSTSTGGAALRG
jgi:probable HAF family extracellular repeat protein